MLHTKRESPGINMSSTADIAFLLLVFFMVTTSIHEEKGLFLLLPRLETDNPAPVAERNVFRVHLNSHDELLVEGTMRNNLKGLQHEVGAFILNYGKNKDLSDSPGKAVVSIKTARGTSHKFFTAVLDEIQRAYYEIYAEQAGISSDEYRRLDITDAASQHLYCKGRAGIPMNISIAN